MYDLKVAVYLTIDSANLYVAFDVIAKFHFPFFNDESDIERTIQAHQNILNTA